MFNNKKGQVWAYALMLGLTIIILALALAPAANNFISSTMNETTGDLVGLDCSNESISNFDRAACVVTDYSIFYFIGGLILIGGIVVTARIIF